ncbi:hypothetical protein LOK49_LG07G00516, partial [Camellia lanceoleosa]
SCIAMTLAETLIGLDAFYRRETTRFAGSPLLLQVDLLEPVSHFLENLSLENLTVLDSHKASNFS